MLIAELRPTFTVRIEARVSMNFCQTYTISANTISAFAIKSNQNNLPQGYVQAVVTLQVRF